ncbi:protein mono-ADP-ribosyltransferase PARP12-like [Penaeus japonicus]|uniref:protein mono-ADP-ribosyltransferase PARP12-like n=1 Tax=Penaeus japonicus TaxID=27405 RepID=UPI001C711E45|nr:protein mono-ADP-ribosyltransferase PARP12-like [Penaeus japonicus]
MDRRLGARNRKGKRETKVHYTNESQSDDTNDLDTEDEQSSDQGTEEEDEQSSDRATDSNEEDEESSDQETDSDEDKESSDQGTEEEDEQSSDRATDSDEDEQSSDQGTDKEEEQSSDQGTDSDEEEEQSSDQGTDSDFSDEQQEEQDQSRSRKHHIRKQVSKQRRGKKDRKEVSDARKKSSSASKSPKKNKETKRKVISKERGTPPMAKRKGILKEERTTPVTKRENISKEKRKPPVTKRKDISKEERKPPVTKRKDISREERTPPTSTRTAKKSTPKSTTKGRNKDNTEQAGKGDHRSERNARPSKIPKEKMRRVVADDHDEKYFPSGEERRERRRQPLSDYGQYGNPRSRFAPRDSLFGQPDAYRYYKEAKREVKFIPKDRDIWLNSANQVFRDRRTYRLDRTFELRGSIHDLVEILSHKEELQTSIVKLTRKLNTRYEDVDAIVTGNDHVFQISNEIICLRPKVNMCLEHLEDMGCKDKKTCSNLHICQDFLKGICNYTNCNMGHTIKTHHNQKILRTFYLDELSTDVLLEILRRVLVVGSRGSKSQGSKGESSDPQASSSHGIGFEKDAQKRLRRFLKEQKNIDLSSEDEDEVKEPKRKTQNSTVWSTDSHGDVEIPEICYESVEGTCSKQEDGCERLHSFHHYYWQISKDKSEWLNLPPKLVLCLEKSYCSVSADGVTLPRMKDIDLHSLHTDAVKILSRDEWTSDFQEMSLENSAKSVKVHLRRLCTEKLKDKSVKANTFIWYFKDDNNEWIPYGSTNSDTQEGLGITSTPEDIEKHFLRSPTTPLNIRSKRFSYVLDLQKLIQTNVITHRKRNLRRRPEGHVQDIQDQTYLPEEWETMQPKERMRFVELDPRSAEYKKVINLLKDDNYKSKVKKIQRNQNPYLWKALQNKIEEMVDQYGDEASVNMKYLFHGTKADIINNICNENFDFRLHGETTGHIWGKGAYFGNDIAYCYRYCQPDSASLRHMIVAKVLVGTITLGQKDLKRPPKDQATGYFFDTTVNDVAHPSIFVKYDKQEYYPNYLITMA